MIKNALPPFYGSHNVYYTLHISKLRQQVTSAAFAVHSVHASETNNPLPPFTKTPKS